MRKWFGKDTQKLTSEAYHKLKVKYLCSLLIVDIAPLHRMGMEMKPCWIPSTTFQDKVFIAQKNQARELCYHGMMKKVKRRVPLSNVIKTEKE